MGDFVWNFDTRCKYFYKRKVASKTGKEYWRYYHLKWEGGPTISRVKLNPEQAVLTCCDVALFSKVFDATRNACSTSAACTASKSTISS